MSFQPVISVCRAPLLYSATGDFAAGWLYIDSDRVLRASPGISVPAGLEGLSDCVEVSCRDCGYSFTVLRRDGSVYWVYRAEVGGGVKFEYTIYTPDSILDGERLGVVVEAVSNQLGGGGAPWDSFLMMRNVDGKAFSVRSLKGYPTSSYVSKRTRSNGVPVKATSLGPRNYTGDDGQWVEYAVAGVETIQGAAQGSVYRYDRVGLVSSLNFFAKGGGADVSNSKILLLRHFPVARSSSNAVQFAQSYLGGIFEENGERFVSLFRFPGLAFETRTASYNGVTYYRFPVPNAVMVFEAGWITADGQIFWLLPDGASKDPLLGSSASIGPLNTAWSTRRMEGLSAFSAGLLNRIDDLQVVVIWKGSVVADLQSFLTLSITAGGVGAMGLRWDPEFGNQLEFPQANFAGIGAIGATLAIVATAPFSLVAMAGVASMSLALLTEKELSGVFSGVAYAQFSLGSRAGFPDGVVFTGVSSGSGKFSVGRVYPDAVVRLERAAGVVSLGPENDVMLRGARYQNARWTREGSIPLGLNWGSSPEGLRFWGTPQESGEMTAIFEGPYPDGFQSTLTDGGQQDGGQTKCSDLGNSGSFVVERYVVKFLITEVPGTTGTDGQSVVPTTYTLGEVLAEWLAHPSNALTARRQAWEGTRCIGTRGGTARITRSDVAPVVPATVSGKAARLFYHYTSPSQTLSAAARLVQAGEVVAEDMAAADWVLSAPGVMSRGSRGVLRTAGVQVQALSAETALDYADYVGEALDGERRVCAFQAEVPILPGVSWGEFYMKAGFSGSVAVLFYTLREGVLLDAPAAVLGLRFFHRIQEASATTYRDSDEAALAYDAVSGAGAIYRSVVPVEVRYGIFRLSAPLDVRPGAVASLSIFVTKEGV